MIRPAFYGIYEAARAKVEVYCLVANQYQLLSVNERGHYSIPPLRVELGIWQGEYQNMNLPWLRWWDAEGDLLLTGEERAILAEQQIQAERQRAEQERQQAEALAAQLKALGVDPDL